MTLLRECAPMATTRPMPSCPPTLKARKDAPFAVHEVEISMAYSMQTGTLPARKEPLSIARLARRPRRGSAPGTFQLQDALPRSKLRRRLERVVGHHVRNHAELARHRGPRRSGDRLDRSHVVRWFCGDGVLSKPYRTACSRLFAFECPYVAPRDHVCKYGGSWVYMRTADLEMGRKEPL